MMIRKQKAKSVRTYYYVVGFLGTYVYDTPGKCAWIDADNMKKVRASNMKEAREKVRGLRAEELLKSLVILPREKDNG